MTWLRAGTALGAALVPVAVALAAATPVAGASAVSLSILAGTGTAGAPVPGPATSSPLQSPNDVAASATGDVYIADYGANVVDKVTPTGTLSVFAGTGTPGLPTAGPATKSDLRGPAAVAVGSAGDIYIADSTNDCVEEVAPTGTLSIFAGVCGAAGNSSSGVKATTLHMRGPQGLAVDGTTGDVYIADTYNNVIDKVAPTGTSNVVAGINQRGGTPTPGPATSSNIAPHGIALDKAGDLYIADSPHHVVEEVTPAGTLSIVAGEIGHNGMPTAGPATSSYLGAPTGVAFDATGDLYIADAADNVVEKVSTSGMLTVVAGTGTAGLPTPGSPTSSDLHAPAGVAVGPTGALYIADFTNHDVERVGAPTAVAPAFTADTPPRTVLAGSSFTYTFAASGSPAPAFAVASGALPAGLQLDPTTGVLSGTPTASGTFVVSAANAGGTVTTPSITITVSSPTPGATATHPPTTPTPPATSGSGGSISVSPSGGYWAVSAAGTLSTHGGAPDLGSENGAQLNAPVVSVRATPDGKGYWEVAADGGVFSFGDAGFYGSMGGKTLAEPVVGLAATPTGKGYWEAAKDGGVFAFGDAGFYGSMGGKPLAGPVVGMLATPTGKGYWEVAADGGVFAFGSAPFYGSMGGKPLAAPVVGMLATPTGKGYWEVAADGGVFAFGSAPFYGSMGGKPLAGPVVGIVTSGATGYELVSSNGTEQSFGT